MQYANSDLENLVPIWQRELPNRVNEPVRDRLIGVDVNVLGFPIGQNCIGNVGPLAQDVFGALIIRQGAIQRAL